LRDHDKELINVAWIDALNTASKRHSHGRTPTAHAEQGSGSWWSVKIQTINSVEHFFQYGGRYARRPVIAQSRITNLDLNLQNGPIHPAKRILRL
jgi:putative transposase